MFLGIDGNFKKLWSFRKHLKIEGAAFFLMFPAFLSIVIVPVFELEKACLVNLRYEKDVCSNLNNAKFKQICQTENITSTVIPDEVVSDLVAESQLTGIITLYRDNHTEFELIQRVCEAEKESQKLLSKLYAYRAPVATVFSLLIVTFAGAWSDKYDIHKPFLYVPMLGELITMTVFLISAIFMDSIGTQYAVIAAKVIPALTGGTTLFFIGLTSFMTVTTTDEQRTLRFGVFSMYITVLGIISAPLSGVLYKLLTYVQFFALNFAITVAGLVYTLHIDDVSSNKEKSDVDTKVRPEQESSNFLANFFDRKHITKLVEVVKKEREGQNRKILFLTILCHAVFFSTHGEDSLHILFARTALRWTTEFGFFIMYTTSLGLLGTTIVTTIFIKYFHFEDTTLTAISLIGSLISKPVVAFSRTTASIYVAGATDLFGAARYLAIKSMISKIVGTDELGRVYSIVGITDNLDMLILAPIYSFIYYKTLDVFPGTIFLFSEVFLAASLAILVVLIYYKAKERRQKKMEMKPKRSITDVSPTILIKTLPKIEAT